MDWFVIYTKRGNEERVSKRLESAGFETLFPKTSACGFVGRRLTSRVEPLFPCYIFCRLEPLKHSRMLRYTRGVRYLVGGDAPEPVSKDIIDTIIKHTRDGLVVSEPEDLFEGDRVVITGGPLKNFMGVFKHGIKGSERVAILLESLKYGVELSREMIKKASR